MVFCLVPISLRVPNTAAKIDPAVRYRESVVVATKISVCIPVKNGGSFLPLAVESVLGQLLDDVELIIVDNCSSDGTAQWLEQQVVSAPRTRFYRNAADIGMTANFNACLKLAQGKYVKFLCADDLLLPQSLQRMSQVLDGDPRISLVVGGRRLIDESGAKITTQNYATRDATMPGTQVINRCLFGGNDIGEPSAVMFRRAAAERGFQESLSQLMDLEMWFHLLEQGNMASLADEVCAIRQHPGQLTRQSITTGALIDENISLFKEYGDRPYIEKTLFNVLMRKIRMAYRVWLCRDSLPIERRNRILADHSSRLLYFLLMPPIGEGLAIWRKLAVIMRTAIRVF
jgi:glycosyltransferase involved in cell wall biosynthesis